VVTKVLVQIFARASKRISFVRASVAVLTTALGSSQAAHALPQELPVYLSPAYVSK
jgi:hypothetical protein